MITEPFSDIKADHFWIRILPRKFQPYGRLARLDRPIGVWLLLLPGWCAIMLATGGAGAMPPQDWLIFALFLPGAIIMRAAGCVINDLWDRDLDRQVERTQSRPLASGEISRKNALIFLLILLFSGLLILLQLNLAAVLLGFLALPLIISYPLMKRITWWPQAFLGITFNFSALIGWAAVTEALSPAVLALYAGFVCWTLGYDTIYAHQDKEDDALAGIKSSALRLGKYSRPAVYIFYALHFAALTGALLLTGAGILQFILLLPAAAYMIKLLTDWQPDDETSSLQIFKANRNYGLLILLACVV